MAKTKRSDSVKLLSLDLGFSSIKLAYINNDGDLRYEKFVSGIAKLPEPPLDMGDETACFQFNGNYFIIGNESLNVPKSYLLNLEDYNQLKESYPPILSFLLNRFQNSGLVFDKIIIGLSLAFKDKADELLSYIYSEMMWNPEDNKVICLPQGLSGKVSYNEYGLSLRERSTEAKLLSYLLVDIGSLTIDIANVNAGGKTTGGAMGYPNTGVIVIARNIQEYLFKTFEIKVSIKEALSILDNEGDFTKRGKRYDISDKIDDFCIKYLSDVLRLIEDRYGEDLDVVSGIVVIGGGAYILQKYKNTDAMRKEIEKHFSPSFLHVPENDGEYYNCNSYLRIVQKWLDEGKLS